MFSKINSFSTRGIDGYRITVEVDVSNGLPSFVMVGYLAEEVREAQERVRTALRNAGFRLPPKRITVNLSPAGVRKEGTGCDLAIAAGILRCLWKQREKTETEQNGMWLEMDDLEDGISQKEEKRRIELLAEKRNDFAADWEQWAFIGELGLDGSVKPLTGVLSMVYEARRCGMKRVFLSEENVQEGRAVEGIEIIGVRDVKTLTDYLQHPEQIRGQWFSPELFQPGQEEFDIDFDEIVGLPLVRRATEAAAAGRHNILYIGPAGTGKTMAARRIPTILPPLTLEESIEVSKIYSICGLLKPDMPLVLHRPFRSPHHSTTAQAMAGGGRNPKPGEISLASHGTLFLDELAEFQPTILDLLRQPMEEGSITVSRLNQTVVFPAKTMIAAAMNPCKCGFFPDLGKCRCTPTQIRRYLNRVSGPFLDRIDIGVEVPRQDLGMGAAGTSAQEESFPQDGRKNEQGDSSAVMRARVMEARIRQEKRFAGDAISYNSQMSRRQIEAYCHLSNEDARFLEKVERQQGISARGHGKILKVARTLADLDGQAEIGRTQLAEAIGFRSFEKKYWGNL